MKELWEIVEEHRAKGILIEGEEVERVCGLCRRKMEICHVEDRKKYFPLLFRDELKNYLFRRAVNAAMIMANKKEAAV